jgi:hypothetical protein
MRYATVGSAIVGNGARATRSLIAAMLGRKRLFVGDWPRDVALPPRHHQTPCGVATHRHPPLSQEGIDGCSAKCNAWRTEVKLLVPRRKSKVPEASRGLVSLCAVTLATARRNLKEQHAHEYRAMLHFQPWHVSGETWFALPAKRHPHRQSARWR